jgi:glycerol-3-phosphate dehydrogenase
MRMHRAETLERLHREQIDLVVIGAGIIGARIAYEAARSGLRVALVDAGDFGGATSSASSKLVHGGFRYLPMGDVGLVRQSQHERQVLMDVIAPNLVRPMPFLLPAYGESPKGPATVATGLLLYRALAGRGGHVGLVSDSTARALVPPLRTKGLRMSGLFEEAETIDSRLVLATVKAAAGSGALVVNYARVVGLELRHNRSGVVTIDAGRDIRLELRARHVINAAGPWVDHVRRLDDPTATALVRLSKGVHVLLPLERPWSAGVAMPLPGGRVALGIPWQGMLMLGTTDTLYVGNPSDVRVTGADVDVVLEEASRYLPPELLRSDQVRLRIAGLRDLPIEAGSTAEAHRGHPIETSRDGLISVAGGKLTTHRLIAVDALRRVHDQRVASLMPDCRQLPGTGWSSAVEAHAGLPADVADNLARLYGGEAGHVLRLARTMPNGLARIHPDGPDVWAQAAYAVDSEWACSADDITRRRTSLSVRGLATGAINQLMSTLVGAAAMQSSSFGHAAAVAAP